MNYQDYQDHPIAAKMPLLPDDELQALAKSIKERGLIEPIKIWEGMIIDGRNRYRACRIAEVEPRFEPWQPREGESPWLAVWDWNAQRRHLEPGTRAALWELVFSVGDFEWQAQRQAIKEAESKAKSEAAKAQPRDEQGVYVPPMPQTDNVVRLRQPEEPDRHPTRAAEASRVGVSQGTLSAVKVLKKTRPDLLEKVATGELSIPAAKKVIRQENIEQQREAIKEGKVAMPLGLFEVISIDPPWPYGREYDPDGSRVANPYPEMSIEQIASIKLPASPDSVLFLWTTHKFLPDSFKLMEGWGYTYKATMVWDKKKIGIGQWFRMQCEFCLVGIKGSPFWQNTLYPELISEPRREHSRKPDAFFELVSRITEGRRLEYFAREKREGWEVMGNDVEKFA